MFLAAKAFRQHTDRIHSVFDRYNIVSDADLRATAEKRAADLSEESNFTGTLWGAPLDFQPAEEVGANT